MDSDGMRISGQPCPTCNYPDADILHLQREGAIVVCDLCHLEFLVAF